MYRRIGVVALILLLHTVAVVSQSEAVEEPSFDELLQILEQSKEILDQAIYLAAAGMVSYDLKDQSIYSQGILNLLEGPSSFNYSEDNPYVLQGHPGFGQSLFLIVDGDGFSDVIESRLQEADDSQLTQALQTAYNFSRLAAGFAKAALDQAQRKESATDSLRSVYAHLMIARGGMPDSELLDGFRAVLSILVRSQNLVLSGESIQEVIDRALEGATIRIRPGIYSEALVVTKSVSLVASAAESTEVDGGGAVLTGLLGGCAITVDSDHPISVSVQGLVVTGNWYGMRVANQASVSLADMSFRDNGVALRLEDGGAALVDACEFDGNETAITAWGSSSATIRHSVIQRSTSWFGAIACRNSSLVVENCDLLDNTGAGIEMQPCGSLHLTDSRLLRNGDGLHMTPGGCDENGFPTGPVFPPEYSEVTGWNNVIPEPGEPDGNRESAIDDSVYGGDRIDLSFLMQPRPDDM